MAVAAILQAKGYFRTPGAIAFAAMLTTAGVIVTSVLVYLIGDPVSEWRIIVGAEVLSALLAAAAIYGTKRGWARRAFFTMSAVCVLSIGFVGYLPFLVLMPVILFLALVYGVMAIANPPLRPAETLPQP